MNVDPDIQLDDPCALRASLVQNGIAMSDCIYSCQWIEYRSVDSDLRKKLWNKDGVRQLMDGCVRKILCTSKGVLRMLESSILCPVGDPVATIDIPASIEWQNTLLAPLGGKAGATGSRIASIFTINGITEPIQALAIPSPGSWQRRLKNFGFPAEISLPMRRHILPLPSTGCFQTIHT